jgi:hypothetical protein
LFWLDGVPRHVFVKFGQAPVQGAASPALILILILILIAMAVYYVSAFVPYVPPGFVQQQASLQLLLLPGRHVFAGQPRRAAPAPSRTVARSDEQADSDEQGDSDEQPDIDDDADSAASAVVTAAARTLVGMIAQRRRRARARVQGPR